MLLAARDILLPTAAHTHQCKAATHRYKHRGTFEGRSSFLSIHYGHRPLVQDNNDPRRAPCTHPPQRPPLRSVYFLHHCCPPPPLPPHPLMTPILLTPLIPSHFLALLFFFTTISSDVTATSNLINRTYYHVYHYHPHLRQHYN